MIIEKLNIDDIPNLLKLYDELISFESSLDKSIETYKEMLMDENYFLVVAKEDTKIVGSVLGIYCKCLVMPFLVIEDVIVKDGLRGKGIGQKLMATMDEFAKTKNCSYAILVSSDYRKKAHKFYENIGFIDGVRGFRKMYK
jgi:predicted N-acetyltransferase YhbS